METCRITSGKIKRTHLKLRYGTSVNQRALTDKLEVPVSVSVPGEPLQL